MKMQKLKMRIHGNAKVENGEKWKCKMYFMMSRLGHRTLLIYLLYNKTNLRTRCKPKAVLHMIS